MPRSKDEALESLQLLVFPGIPVILKQSLVFLGFSVQLDSETTASFPKNSRSVNFETTASFPGIPARWILKQLLVFPGIPVRWILKQLLVVPGIPARSTLKQLLVFTGNSRSVDFETIAEHVGTQIQIKTTIVKLDSASKNFPEQHMEYFWRQSGIKCICWRRRCWDWRARAVAQRRCHGLHAQRIQVLTKNDWSWSTNQYDHK